MKPGEIVVARMSGGLSIVRVSSIEANRVTVKLRRNKEARLPAERVVLSTGISAGDEQDVNRLQEQSEGISAEIDVSELWEVVRDESVALGLDELAELYWGDEPEAAQRIGLLIHLDHNQLYFTRDAKGYTPRSRSALDDLVAKREREARNEQSASELVAHLAEGTLPPDADSHQRTLLDHIRGFAVHGEAYTRASLVKGLLNDLERSGGDLQKLAFDLLVRTGIFGEDEPLELERAGIEEAFSQAALDEAETIRAEALTADASRRDLTEANAFTIDDEGTRDRDDALSLNVETSEGGDPVYVVGVHITDAGALIPAGGALDQESDRRMATLYMPERKVPMLPPEVSEEKGSLHPGETRSALSLIVRLSDTGEVLDWELSPSIVSSGTALSYEEADAVIEDTTHPLNDALANLYRLAQYLRAAREEAGAVRLDRPEMSVKVDAEGNILVDVVARTTPARMVVSEFMILCNSLMAEFCIREDIPASFRSQPAPDLSEFDAEYGSLGGMPEGPYRWYLMMKRLPPADIGTVPLAHGGLGVPAYIQVTSPLRRYPDLVMQRQISRYLESRVPQYSTEEIASVAGRADVQLRELSRIEEDRRRYWFLKLMKGQVEESDGQDVVFDAVVLENEPRRIALLELADYPFRVRAQLPDSISAGDAVVLQLRGTDLWQRIGYFIHVPNSPD